MLGVIAEDDSDVDSIVVLCNRISGKKIGCKRYVGRGSGKIIQKCSQWTQQLKVKGCNRLIIINDSDNNDPKEVYLKIKNALGTSPISKYIISVPVQELEAWMLSDPSAIKKAMNLRKEPKINGMPETINSPKEHLGRIVRALDKTKIYLNTVHNVKIAECMTIEKVLSRCPSFENFHNFVENNLS